MKKSLLLLMFALATVGFDVIGGEGAGVEAGDHAGLNGGEEGKQTPTGSTYAAKAYGLITSRPMIITTVSAAAAGTAYAITKFINKQWNKQYPAKKIAAATGIGAGIITGVYLYWPVPTDGGSNSEVGAQVVGGGSAAGAGVPSVN